MRGFVSWAPWFRRYRVNMASITERNRMPTIATKRIGLHGSTKNIWPSSSCRLMVVLLPFPTNVRKVIPVCFRLSDPDLFCCPFLNLAALCNAMCVFPFYPSCQLEQLIFTSAIASVWASKQSQCPSVDTL